MFELVCGRVLVEFGGLGRIGLISVSFLNFSDLWF